MDEFERTQQIFALMHSEVENDAGYMSPAVSMPMKSGKSVIVRHASMSDASFGSISIPSNPAKSEMDCPFVAFGSCDCVCSGILGGLVKSVNPYMVAKSFESAVSG